MGFTYGKLFCELILNILLFFIFFNLKGIALHGWVTFFPEVTGFSNKNPSVRCGIPPN